MPTSATRSRVRLSRDELHQLRWLLGLGLVLLALWTLYQLDTQNLRELVVVTGLVGLALAFPGLPGRIPSWGWRLGLPIGAALLVMRILSPAADFLSCLILLVLLLTLFRTLQYRRRREDWQLVLLCLFIIVLTGVLTLSLMFAVQILLFTLVTMALLFVMNLLERDAPRALATGDWKNFHWPHFLRRLRDALDTRLLALAGGLFLCLVLVGTVIFVAIPRYHFEQAFSMPRLRGVAGFSDRIDYQDRKSYEHDDTVVLRVDVPENVNFSTAPYWRMIVFDDYTKRGFGPSGHILAQQFERRSTRVWPSDNSRRSDIDRPAGRWKFYYEGNVSEYLPVVGVFESMVFPSPQTFREAAAARLYRLDAPSPNVLGYEITNMDVGDAIPATEADARMTPAAIAENYQRIQENKGRVEFPFTYLRTPASERATLMTMVDEIRGGNGNMTQADFIAKAVAYLRAHHGTAMKVDLSGVPGDHDPLVKWMISNSPGWCEHFAGSLVLLARAAGYPARIAAGYKGARFNSIENYYVVRESDAHAWAEVYDGVNRWLRVDPTPSPDTLLLGLAGRRASGIETESGWQAWLDSLRMVWYRRVINFDQADQQQLAESIGQVSRGFFSRLGSAIDSAYDRVRAWLAKPWTWERSLILGAVVAIGIALYLLRGRASSWWLTTAGRRWFGRLSATALVRRDAGRWLRKFLPAWQAAATRPSPERMAWDAARLELLALRYGPPDSLGGAAGIFRKVRILLRRRPQSATIR